MKIFSVPWGDTTINKLIINDLTAGDGIIFLSGAVSAQMNGALFRNETQLYAVSKEIENIITDRGYVINPLVFNQASIAITEEIQTALSFKKGHIYGGIPSYVSGTELQFSELEARSDDNTFDILGGVFNKKTAKPFVVGSGNAGLVLGATNAWNITGADEAGATSTPSGTTQPEGLIWLLNGTRLFIADNAGNRIVQYNPGTAYDASTKGAIVNILNVTPQGTAPYDLTATADALELYVANDGGDAIDQYSMGTAGDLSTAVFAGSFGIGATQTNPRGIDIDPLGNTLVVVGTQGQDAIDEYSFGTTKDITTLVHTGVITLLSLGISENAVESIRYGDSGAKLYILGNQNNAIFEFDISAYSPFADITYTGKAFDVSNQDANPTGFFIKEDGLELYLTGDTSDNIFTYNMDTIFNMSLHAFGISKTSDGAYDVAFDSDPLGANVLIDPTISGALFDKKVMVCGFITASLGNIPDFTAKRIGSDVDVFHKNRTQDEQKGTIFDVPQTTRLSVPNGECIAHINAFSNEDGAVATSVMFYNNGDDMSIPFSASLGHGDLVVGINSMGSSNLSRYVLNRELQYKAYVETDVANFLITTRGYRILRGGQ